MFLVSVVMARMATLAAICTTFHTDYPLIFHCSTSQYFNDWHNTFKQSHKGNLLATSAKTSQIVTRVTFLIQMYHLINAGLVMMRSNQVLAVEPHGQWHGQWSSYWTLDCVNSVCVILFQTKSTWHLGSTSSLCIAQPARQEDVEVRGMQRPEEYVNI